jgi:hypothetical protein
MRKLYVNDKLVLVIYDSNVQVSGEDDESIDLHDYIYDTIYSNMYYDGVYHHVYHTAKYRWEKENEKEIK